MSLFGVPSTGGFGTAFGAKSASPFGKPSPRMGFGNPDEQKPTGFGFGKREERPSMAKMGISRRDASTSPGETRNFQKEEHVIYDTPQLSPDKKLHKNRRNVGTISDETMNVTKENVIYVAPQFCPAIAESVEGRLVLSSLGLKRVREIDMEQDFTFLVGGHEYRCSRFAAAFISNRVTKQMQVDKTFNCIKIDLEDNSREFALVMKLLAGEAVQLNSKNIDYWNKVALKLENDELQAEVVRQRYLEEAMSPASIVDRMTTKLKFKSAITEEIAYSAANVEQIAIEDLKLLNPSVVEAIVTHADLKLTNEDSLLSIILKLGSKFRFLLQYVQCEYLSNDGITLFLKQIDIKDLNSMMWDSLKRRLTGYVTPKTTLGKRFGGEVFKYDPGKDWNGVFAHMFNKFGANFYNNKIVNTTCSNPESGNFVNIVRPDYEGCVVSQNNEQSSQFVVDFKEHRFSPNYYTVRAGNQGSNYLKGWCVEVSNDQKEWIAISQVKSRDLRTNYAIKSFPCECGSFVRYIRFRQTKINTSLTWHLSLSRFELYGTLIKPPVEPSQ